MNDLRQAAMQQALEALDEAATFHRNLPDQHARRLAAMTALRAALAQEPCEPLEALKRALEIIAVGDSKNPQQDAAAALVDIGFWSGGAAR